MQDLDPTIHRLLLDRHGELDPRWLERIAIPGDDAFPTLRLPAERLKYATDRGYPISFAARRVGATPLLVVELTSYVLEDGPGDWAIPCAYTPRDDDQRIRQALGFDEGWEQAAPECMFVCGRDTLDFWRDAATRGRFGLTIVGARSLYPVKLGARERDELDDFEQG